MDKKNRTEVEDLFNVTKKQSKDIFQIPSVLYKDQEQAIIDYSPRVHMSVLFLGVQSEGGFILQAFQRVFAVDKDKVLELFSMFDEIKKQLSIVTSYEHNVGVICLNTEAEYIKKKVISVFDGQHRIFFFILVLLAIMKVAKRIYKKEKYSSLKKLMSDIKRLLFKNNKFANSNLIIRYANKNLQKDLEVFFESYENNFSEKKQLSGNDFYQYFKIIEKEVDSFIANFETEVDGLVVLYNYVIKKTSAYVRKKMPYETESGVYMSINKEGTKFFESEAVKMITSGFIANEEDKLDYAQKINRLYYLLRKENKFSESDISHTLRFSVLSITKDTKFHIAITQKAKDSSSLRGVVNNEPMISNLFKEANESDKKGYEKFYTIVEQYAIVFSAIKTGEIDRKLITNDINPLVEGIIKIYALVYRTLDSLGERFSYLVIEQVRKMFFEEGYNTIRGRGSKKVEKEEAFVKEHLSPVLKFLELLVFEFLVHGTNTLKKYEKAFDCIFVDILNNENFEESFKKNILNKKGEKNDKIKMVSSVDKEINFNLLKSRLEEKENISEIHSKKNIQRMFLFLIDCYTQLDEGSTYLNILTEFSTVLSFDKLVEDSDEKKDNASNFSIEHVLPESLYEEACLWYFQVFLELDINIKCSDKPLEKKKEFYEYSCCFSLDTFNAYKSYEEIIADKKVIKKNRISLILDQMSLLK